MEEIRLIQLFTRLFTSRVVEDFFHQQHFGIPINLKKQQTQNCSPKSQKDYHPGSQHIPYQPALLKMMLEYGGWIIQHSVTQKDYEYHPGSQHIPYQPALLKMMFLFQRLDMLLLWRVLGKLPVMCTFFFKHLMGYQSRIQPMVELTPYMYLEVIGHHFQ